MTFSWNEMIIQRDKHLNKLIGWKHTDLIKVVNGIRRCGKSFLLFTLFHQHLLDTGIDESHIIDNAIRAMAKSIIRLKRCLYISVFDYYFGFFDFHPIISLDFFDFHPITSIRNYIFHLFMDKQNIVIFHPINSIF